MQNAKTVRFMIMGSVFYTDRFIHESYDLKGSTHGRAATASEKMQDVPVLKDLDFLEREVKIDIGEEKAAMFLDQLKKDTDVSLLVQSLV
jgi:1-phosphatidylinositol-4-phosphate 5-kinase